MKPAYPSLIGIYTVGAGRSQISVAEGRLAPVYACMCAGGRAAIKGEEEKKKKGLFWRSFFSFKYKLLFL